MQFTFLHNFEIRKFQRALCICLFSGLVDTTYVSINCRPKCGAGNTVNAAVGSVYNEQEETLGCNNYS